jgi:hypothetical protein
MPRGDKSKYTDKQERKADHIAESYEARDVSDQEAERRARAIIGKGLTVREAAVRIKVGKTALYEALSPGSARAN